MVEFTMRRLCAGEGERRESELERERIELV